MSCDNYPSKKDVEDFALNAKVINEFATATGELTPSAASDGKQKITLAEIWRQANEKSVTENFLYDHTWQPWIEGNASIAGESYRYKWDSGHVTIVTSKNGAIMGESPDYSEFPIVGNASFLDFGAVGDGTTDDTAAIQSAMDHCAANKVPLYSSSGVFLISKADGAWALDIPSGLNWHTDETAFFQLADNQPGWTRAVSLVNVENVNIYGTLRVDGAKDRQNDPSKNEHMHCVFFFNASNVYIDSIHATNANSDTVSISGDGSLKHTDKVHIGRIIGINAGRKCLVLEGVSNLYIGDAYLDNSINNLNCLDFEPWGLVESAETLKVTINKLVSRGGGDDYTTGTSQPISNKYQIMINDYTIIQTKPTGSTAVSILTYASNVKIGRLHIYQQDPASEYTGNVINGTYASQWDIDQLEIEVNTSADHISLQANNGSPEWNIGTLLSKGRGGFLACRGGRVNIDLAKIYRSTDNTFTLGQSQFTNDGAISISNLYTENIGQFLVSNYGSADAELIKIGSWWWVDNRESSLISPSLFQFAVDANDYAVINQWNKPSGVTLTTVQAGGRSYIATSSASFLVNSTSPENVVLADIGATCSSLVDGSVFKKTLNSTRTGWVKIA